MATNERLPAIFLIITFFFVVVVHAIRDFEAMTLDLSLHGDQTMDKLHFVSLILLELKIKRKKTKRALGVYSAA